MVCREAIEAILAGESGAVALEEHLAQCSDCRRARDLLAAIADLGVTERGHDLPQEVLQDTRKEAALVLAEITKRGLATWFPTIPRRAMAVALPALLLLVVSAVYLGPRLMARLDSRRGSEYAALDEEIEKVRLHVGEAIAGLSRTVRVEQRSEFEVRSEALRSRIEAHSEQVRGELLALRNADDDT